MGSMIEFKMRTLWRAGHNWILARSSRRAFTLIELMAVVVVVLVLAAIGLGVAGYVQKKVATANARIQIAALEAALESYKSDWGYYPASTKCRISATGFWESTNNWILYRALSGGNGGKRYLQFPPNQLRASVGSGSSGSTNGGLMNICDPWSMPYSYYCSPKTTYAVSNALPAGWPAYASPAWNAYTNYWSGGHTEGGQVNVGAYDLLSYGPDRSTYVTGAVPYSGGFNYAWQIFQGGAVAAERWTNTTKALDDITNFGR